MLEEGQENGGRTLQGVGRSNVLGRTTVFLSRIEEAYPERGEFLLRVRARAELKAGARLSRDWKCPSAFELTLNFPRRIVGSTDVQSESVRTYEFRGRIEDFPLPVANPKQISRSVDQGCQPLRRRFPDHGALDR